MSQAALRKGCALALAVFCLLALAFWLIAGDAIRFRDESTELQQNIGIVGELTSEIELSQRIYVPEGRLVSVELLTGTYARENTGTLVVDVYRGGELLGSGSVALSGLADNMPFTVPLNVEVGSRPAELELRISAPESVPGNAVTLYYAQPGEFLTLVNRTPIEGSLCLAIQTRIYYWFGTHYWQIAAVVFVLLALYGLWLLRVNRSGGRSFVLSLFRAATRYRYLIKQLVARDFKTRYKRSALGVLWSFLNPLLTMIVQYIVFSTIFRTDIPNFVVYLLSGIVCFNFFTEATSMALTSIVGNVGLITKVYVPKYIYPLTRVMSSTINLLLSLLPLLIVLLITRTPLRLSMLLLPVPLVCLFLFSLGIGLILASSMVFFRDTQFLWTVLSMLWMYLTPIFYPDSIIPVQWRTLYRCNPLYQIIRFMRTLLLDGVSPEPKAYLFLLLATLVPLGLGIFVFKKTQDRFILHL